MWPSTNKLFSSKCFNKLHQRVSLDKTLAFPKIIIPYLALVRVTFNLLGSVKKPIPSPSLDRTQEIKIKSFSLP